MIKPYAHQEEISDSVVDLLNKYRIAYLAMEERTGKTLTAILACEKIRAPRVLVITKKNAIKGWEETLDLYSTNTEFTIINYHSVQKIQEDFDLVVLDEAHSYVSAFPKRSKMWHHVREKTKGKPLIYMSATPYAQGAHLLFNQLALSDFSPWAKYATPYIWYRFYAKLTKFGETEKIRIGQRLVEAYTVRTDDVVNCVKPLMITRTRQELGFEHEPEDVLHYVELGETTKLAYNRIMKDKVLHFNLNDKTYELTCDSPMKLRTSLHMLEGGVLKIGDDYLVLSNQEKIDYIKNTFGDSDKNVIMYNFIAEGEKLRQAFKHTQILQATSYAEGVDLSDKDNLIIYSQDYSTARHTQRRARQANKKRDKEIKVNFILVNKAVSEQVYKTVTVNKQNFVDKTFNKQYL